MCSERPSLSKNKSSGKTLQLHTTHALAWLEDTQALLRKSVHVAISWCPAAAFLRAPAACLRA